MTAKTASWDVHGASPPSRTASRMKTAFRDLVEWQIDEGTQRPRAGRHNGESPTLSHNETSKSWNGASRGQRGACRSSRARDQNPPRARSSSPGMPSRPAPTPYGGEGLIINKSAPSGPLPAYQAIKTMQSDTHHIYKHPGPRGGRHVGRNQAGLVELPNIAGFKDATPTRDTGFAASWRWPSLIQLLGRGMRARWLHGACGHGCIRVTSNVAPR